MSRFSLTRRRYAGIVLDVFFDHCLARDWALYADRPLEHFTSDVYRKLSSERQLPERSLAKIAPHMVANIYWGLTGSLRCWSRCCGDFLALDPA